MVERTEISWRTVRTVRETLDPVKRSLGLEKYETSKQELQDHLSSYFTSGDCTNAGGGISPIGATARGGKQLKVRWAMPGSGKRGGLRLGVIAYCETRTVVLAFAAVRRDDPANAEFESAFGSAEAEVPPSAARDRSTGDSSA